MSKYRVRGVSRLGVITEVLVAADSAEAAGEQAAKVVGDVIQVRAAGWQFADWVRHRRLDIGLLTHEVLSLLQAGLSLIEALEALVEREGAVVHDRQVLLGVLGRVREGQPLSRALRGYPREFPELFVASIAASEHTGELVDALQRFLRYNIQTTQARQKIVSASLYPLLLMAAGTAVGVFLLCYLVPRFSEVYDNINTELPLLSRWMMGWGRWLNGHWPWALGGALSLAVALVLLSMRPEVRNGAMALLIGNRWIGPKVRLAQLSRFYRALGLLLSGGIPMIKALRTVRGLLDDSQKAALDSTIREVEEGKRLSDGLANGGLVTSVALRLIRVGERNGQLATMLEQTAQFHDAEVTQWLERFSRLFEPILMVVIGLVIGAIVILLYLPIFDLAGGVQ
ncbi:type II secretion system F family protein [Pseudomonas soli]|uniref:type II secretion system F family protein n=1 Tax=Pseudomonas soli TaxID=1306993 RepID=UPI0037F56F63